MEILKASDDDTAEIVSLFQQYRFALHQHQWFNWKYFQNPVGKALRFKITQNNQIVGAVAITPHLFHYRGERIYGLQTVDGLLGTEIRGKGYFNQLMSFLSTQVPDMIDGKYFYLSFPSLAASVKAHENAGWYRLANFSLRSYLLTHRPLLKFKSLKLLEPGIRPFFKIARKMMFSNSDPAVSIRPVTQFTSGMNIFLNSEKVSGERSRAFLEWRVANNPRDTIKSFAIIEKGHLVGYAVCKIVGSAAELVELKLLEHKKSYVVCLLKYIYQNKLADSVDFWGFGSADLENLLPAGLNYKRKFTGALFVKGFEEANLPGDHARWDISYLDSDW